jgi:signal peptidase I
MNITRRNALWGAGAAIAFPFAAAAEDDPLRSFMIPSESMEPNLKIGDVVLTRRVDGGLATPPRRGDIVIFRREENFWVKRLIGLPGDVVAMEAGVPILNGQRLPHYAGREPERPSFDRAHVVEPPKTNRPVVMIERLGERRYRVQERAIVNGEPAPARRDVVACTVPNDCVYLIGDNRDESLDSRSFGPAPHQELRFVAIQILHSQDPSRIGLRLDRNVI